MWLFALVLAADSLRAFDVPLSATEYVHVTVSGRGAPVVMVPGLIGSAFGFRRLMPLLRDAGYQSIVIEPLGIGGSARPRDADYSLAAQAERVAATLDSLELEDVIIIAHSLGAAIAFRVAVFRPELVAGILSLDGGPAEAIGSPGFRRSMRLVRIIRLGGIRLVRHQVRQRLIAASGDPSWVTDEVVDGYTVDAARNLGATLQALAAMAKAEEPYELMPVLSAIRCPVRLLVGTGERDGGISPYEIELLRRRLPRFAIEQVPEVGHFVFEERPEAVVHALGRLEEEARRETVVAGS